MNADDVIVAVLGGGNLLLFIKFLIERYDAKKESPERMMLKALGAERLGLLLRDWLHSDVRTASDWQIIDDLYCGYIALGGNSEIKKLYNEAKDIPTTE